MWQIEPVVEAGADEKARQTLGRLRELFGEQSLPGCFLIYARVPAFLQDFYMNFKKFVWSDGAISPKTKCTIALAVSSFTRCKPWMDFLADRCRQLGADDQYLADVVAVTSSCAMYNAFFKFRDISGSELFSGMAVGLRAHTFSNTTLDDTTVELINVAISDINGCKPCTAGHVEKARQLGVSHDALLETIQCASTMLSGTSFLNAVNA